MNIWTAWLFPPCICKDTACLTRLEVTVQYVWIKPVFVLQNYLTLLDDEDHTLESLKIHDEQQLVIEGKRSSPQCCLCCFSVTKLQLLYTENLLLDDEKTCHLCHLCLFVLSQEQRHELAWGNVLHRQQQQNGQTQRYAEVLWVLLHILCCWAQWKT